MGIDGALTHVGTDDLRRIVFLRNNFFTDQKNQFDRTSIGVYQFVRISVYKSYSYVPFICSEMHGRIKKECLF